MDNSPLPRKYDVEVAPVLEVSLLGSADLPFWTDRLAPEGLKPLAADGQARVMVCAASARFFGVRFREVSFSVLVEPLGDALPTGAFLAQAFNSIRFFAWVERTRFHTPYQFARIAIAAEPLAVVTVEQAGTSVLRAAMATPPTDRSPLRDGDEGWEGPIHLPTSRQGPRRLFFGKLVGRTQVYRFDRSDEWTLPGAATLPAIDALVASRFQPTEWHIRLSGTHGKSHTHRRPAN